ncbi:MAG: hypothetical protein ABSE43_03355 [Steroidobacteraceae bacterium]|jgi:hypothetical protein
MRALVILVLAFMPSAVLCAPDAQFDFRADIQQLLQKLAQLSPNVCGIPHGPEVALESGELDELRLRSDVGAFVSQQMNSNHGDPAATRDLLVSALSELEKMSADINASWPEENRLHFQLFEFPPAIVLKSSFRAQERFLVLGIPARVNSPQQAGSRQEVGSDFLDLDNVSVSTSLDIYPLHRAAAGNARFLAKFIISGCAGPVGVQYDAEEWDPRSVGSLRQIIKVVGAFGLEKIPSFPPIGELKTDGPHIALPYCWFSRIDTWDNPSLCAVDTYDLSADNVRFQARAYNRPDLVPVAKAIEYALRQDYPAVLGYCASGDIARRLVRNLTPDIFSDDLRIKRLGTHRERIELDDLHGYRFEVEQRNGRWLVVAFSMD